jgi:hypothetical protein
MKRKIIDSHTHLRGVGNLWETLQSVRKIQDNMGLATTNVAALPSWEQASVGQNALCIIYKALYPGSYAYAGLDYYVAGIETTVDGKLQQLKQFMEMGFDGVKIIEGKPTVRKMIGYGMDSHHYQKFFDYLQAQNIPVLWHVADPEENWDPDKCSEAIRQQGWYYGDGSYLKKQELMRETEAVLQKYPKLNVVFAHMLFLSASVAQARRFMEQYPNTRLDITPGIEMYYNFSRQRTDWRDFFVDYQDRLIFGTDNGWGDDASAAQKAIEGCWKIAFLDAFFSTDNEILAWNGEWVRGLALPDEALEKLYWRNFLSMQLGPSPKSVDLHFALKYIGSLYEHVRAQGMHESQIIAQIQEVYKEMQECSK